jgi:hypothetical protein
MRCTPSLFCLVIASVLSLRAAPAPEIRYHKLAPENKFYSEGAAFGDFNKDGVMDAVSGPYWYEGPEFSKRHEIYPALAFDPLKYSDNFLAFTHDFNGDGWIDVLVLGFPGVDASWYENPGAGGGMWRRHVVFLPVDNESPTFADINGDKQPDLVCSAYGRLGYATFNPKSAETPWVFHPISPPGAYQRFTHGLGYGDINGDGRVDLLERTGWWEQPASLAKDPVWKKHEFTFGPEKGRGGAQMCVMDVNGDGLADVVTSIDAHGYGLSWFEQTRSGGEISFREHVLLSAQADEKIGGLQFAQLHAIALADVDGDGLADIVTGKRWWAHGPTGDADPNGTPVLYAFLLRRGANGEVRFEPHQIDDASGIGTQVVAQDINGDGRADIVVGNKRGTFIFISQKDGARK